MRHWTWRAWVCCAAGAALTVGLFVCYVAGRTLLLAAGTVLACVAASSAIATVLGARSARRSYQRSLHDLATHVAALRANPSPNLRVSPDPEVELLYAHLEALAGCYRQALGDLVRANEELDGVHSLLGRADAEKGQSHSFIQRGAPVIGRSRDQMVARLTPNLYWIAATPALQRYLGQSNALLNARSFLESVNESDVPSHMEAFHEALESGEGHNIVFRVPSSGKGDRTLELRGPVPLSGRSGSERHV